MRAVTIPAFGGPDVLTPAFVPEPAPGPGQLAVEVTHAGVNYAEVLFRRGLVPVDLPYVPGIEVAGRAAPSAPASRASPSGSRSPR